MTEALFLALLAAGIATWAATLQLTFGSQRLARAAATSCLWIMAFVTVQGAALVPRAQQIDFSARDRPPLVDAINAGALFTIILLAGASLFVTFVSDSTDSISRRGLPVLGGFILFSLGTVVVGVLSNHPQLSPVSLALPLVAAATMRAPGMTLSRALWHARCILRVLTWGSLLAAVLVPAWAFSVEAQLQDRRVFGIPQLWGLTTQGNALGAAAAVSVILELADTGRGTFGKRHVLAAVAALLLSQSRIAVVAAVVGALLLHIGIAQVVRRVLLVAGALAAVTALLNPAVLDSLSDSYHTSEDLSTVNGRTAVWAVSLREYRENRAFGYGPGLFDATYRRTRLPADLQFAGQGHNQFVHTLGSAGLIGGALLLGYLVALALVAFRGRREMGGLSLALFGVVLAMSMTDVPLLHRGPDLGAMLDLTTVLVLYSAAAGAHRPEGGRLASAGSQTGDQSRRRRAGDPVHTSSGRSMRVTERDEARG